MKNIIMGLIAVGALGLAVWLMVGRGPGNNEDPAESIDQTMYWSCNSCKADVVMTKAQWMDATRTSNFRCESCGSTDLLDAYPCPLCGRAMATVGHGRLPTTCPHCNGTLGDYRDVSGTPGVQRDAAGQPAALPPN